MRPNKGGTGILFEVSITFRKLDTLFGLNAILQIEALDPSIHRSGFYHNVNTFAVWHHLCATSWFDDHVC